MHFPFLDDKNLQMEVPSLASLLDGTGLNAQDVKVGLATALGLYSLYKVVGFVRWQRRVMQSAQGFDSCSTLGGDLSEIVAAGGFTNVLFENLHGKHGRGVLRLMMGPTIANYSVGSPELASQVYKKACDRPKETELFLFYLGNPDDVVVMSQRETNKKLREVLSSAVHARVNIEKMSQVTFREFSSASAVWGDAGAFELIPVLKGLVYDNLGSVFFNRPWLGTKDGDEVFTKHLYLIENSMTYSMTVLLPTPVRYLLRLVWPGYRQYVRTIREWHRALQSIIDERTRAIKNGTFDKNAPDFLTTIIMSDRLTNAQRVGSFGGILNAAFDTVVCTTFWLFFHLSKYPEVQQKLVAELNAQPFQKQGRAPTVEELQACKYLTAVTLESFRFKPTVPVNQRVNLYEDIEIGGVHVEKGTNINVPMLVIFRDPDTFPNPDTFDPERFLGDSDAALKQKNAVTAFGSYTRICVGMNLAKAETRAILAAVLRHNTVRLFNHKQPTTSDIEAGANMPTAQHVRFVFSRNDAS